MCFSVNTAKLCPSGNKHASVSVLQELELRWQEYYELVTMLLQWIRHHILVFEERKFPTSYEEIEVNRSRLQFCLFYFYQDYDEEADDELTHLFSDLQVLWRQFLKFKETELPAKEADKNRSKHIFKSFEVSPLISDNKAAFCLVRCKELQISVTHLKGLTIKNN